MKTLRIDQALGKRIRPLLTLVVLLVASGSIRVDAEVITRTDGRKIEGQIERETETHLTIRTSYGTFQVPKDEIASISGRRPVSENESEAREALAVGDLDRALDRFQAALKDATEPDDIQSIEKMIAQTRMRIRQRDEEQFRSKLTTANQLIEEKRFADAMAELENLARENPDEPAAGIIRRKMGELRMAEAAYYEDQVMSAEAMNAYLRAIEQMPDAAEPYFRIAELLTGRAGSEDEVIRYYEKGIENALQTQEEGDLIEQYYALGKAYLDSARVQKKPDPEKLRKAIEALLVVMRHREENYAQTASRLENAFSQLSETEYDMALMVDMLQKTLAINPEAQKVRWVLAETYIKQKNYDQALQQMQTIEQNAKTTGEPLPPEFHFKMGLTYLAQPRPDYDAALEAFENEISLNKRNYLALIRAAELHAEISANYEKAIEYAQEAIALRKERPEAYLVAADIYLRRSEAGDLLRAERLLNTALRQKEDFHPARLKLAELKIRQQRDAESPDYEEALALLEQVQTSLAGRSDSTLSDEDRKAKADAMILEAEIRNDMNYQRQAIELCDQAIAVYSRSPRAYRVMGDAHIQLKEYPQAKAAYENAIELDPRNADTYMQLGILCQTRLDQYAEAIKYFQAYKENGGTEIDRVNRWIDECNRRLARSNGQPVTTGTLESVAPAVPGEETVPPVDLLTPTAGGESTGTLPSLLP